MEAAHNKKTTKKIKESKKSLKKRGKSDTVTHSLSKYLIKQIIKHAATAFIQKYFFLGQLQATINIATKVATT